MKDVKDPECSGTTFEVALTVRSCRSGEALRGAQFPVLPGRWWEGLSVSGWWVGEELCWLPSPSFLLPSWGCAAHVPGGGQSRAETWSLLSDSTVDTRYSGKKWLAPTGETQPGLS